MNWYNLFLTFAFIFFLFCYIPITIKKTSNAHSEFNRFLQRYNKTYSDEKQYHDHYDAFKKSTDSIARLNNNRKSKLSALYGLTKFSDMTELEFKDRYLQSDLATRITNRKLRRSQDRGRHNHHHRSKRATTSIPLKIDWRESGIVTKVNNQKTCGACWAFSTVQNMESMYAIKYKKITSLSVQQAIDCARYDNDGCNGGDDCTFLQWLKDYSVKVYSESTYPLHLKNEVCKLNNDSFFVQVDKYACDSFVDDEAYIVQAIATIGPVAVAVNAISWQHYIGGIIQFHCGGDFDLLNHSVQLVGYDLTAEIPYYIARNSWGEDFGDKGYLYLAIGDNLCGLANEVSALTVL